MSTAVVRVTTAIPDIDFAQFFDGQTQGTVGCLHGFAYIPDDKVERLAGTVLDENWGRGNWVLERYLAVHVGLAVKQKRYVIHENRFVMCAGHLQSRYGTPVYLSFERNREPNRQPLYLQYVGDRPNVPQLPEQPELPAWPKLPPGAEIIIAHEHILEEHPERVAFLAETPRVAQMCALAGAIQWSLFRDLAIRQLYLGVPSYFVPVYLESREDITETPDLIAPVQVQGEKLFVRTALEPHMAYAWARVVATRHDQLPHWLVTAWRDRADADDATAVEGIERQELVSPN